MRFLLLFAATVLLPQHVNGYYPQFFLTASFFDDLGPGVDRKFVIDISDRTTFVLDRDVYLDKAGINNTFSARYSKTFDKIEDFENTYNFEYNAQASVIYGILGQDRLKILDHVVNASFAVVTSMEVTDFAAKDLSYHWVAGRIGFARGNLTKNDLKRQILRRTGGDNLCLSVIQDDEGRLHSSVSLGRHVYNKSEVVTSFKSLNGENDKGVWQVPLDLINIGRYRLRLNVSAVLSTTLDEIAVPKKILFALNKAINATYDEDISRYYTDCSQKIPLNLGINGKLVKVPFEEWTTPYKGRCYTKIGISILSEYVLGNSFFSSNGVCMDFKEETITIFKPKRNVQPSGGELNGKESEVIKYRRIQL